MGNPALYFRTEINPNPGRFPISSSVDDLVGSPVFPIVDNTYIPEILF